MVKPASTPRGLVRTANPDSLVGIGQADQLEFRCKLMVDAGVGVAAPAPAPGVPIGTTARSSSANTASQTTVTCLTGTPLRSGYRRQGWHDPMIPTWD